MALDNLRGDREARSRASAVRVLRVKSFEDLEYGSRIFRIDPDSIILNEDDDKVVSVFSPADFHAFFLSSRYT